VVAPSATVGGPLSAIDDVSLSMMLVVIVGVVTVAVALPSVTVKVSVPSTMVSGVVAIVNVNSAEPDARSAPVLLVAVTWIVPFGSVVMFVKAMFGATVSPAASSAEKSTPSVAVPEALSSVNVTLWPAPSPTPPLRLTVYVPLVAPSATFGGPLSAIDDV